MIAWDQFDAYREKYYTLDAQNRKTQGREKKTADNTMGLGKKVGIGC